MNLRAKSGMQEAESRLSCKGDERQELQDRAQDTAHSCTASQGAWQLPCERWATVIILFLLFQFRQAVNAQKGSGKAGPAVPVHLCDSVEFYM